MSEKVYLITKFDLIGKILYTYKYMPELEKVDEGHGRIKYIDKETKREYYKSHLWELTTTLSKYKNVFNIEDNEFLPYYADVTEDLPSGIKLEPKTYKNCQLMSQKHGGYLQFYHKGTDTVLRIALNSNFYTPVTIQPINS